MKGKSIFILIFLSLVKLFTQTVEDSSRTNLYITTGYAMKYHLYKPGNYQDYENERNYFNNKSAILINVALGSNDNNWGLEVIGFRYSIGDGTMSRYFTWIFAPSYQKNIKLYKNISLILSTSFSLFSTDPKNILNLSLGAGINYNINNILLCIKNNFCFSPPWAQGRYVPWFLITGVTFKL